MNSMVETAPSMTIILGCLLLRIIQFGGCQPPNYNRQIARNLEFGNLRLPNWKIGQHHQTDLLENISKEKFKELKKEEENAE